MTSKAALRKRGCMQTRRADRIDGCRRAVGALSLGYAAITFSRFHRPSLGRGHASAARETADDAQVLCCHFNPGRRCEIGRLHEQIEKAEEKRDIKEFDALVAELDSLEQQNGA